jgi:hypothetical protein
MVVFEIHLREWFSGGTDAAVIRNVMMAVALADDLRRNTPWLGLTDVGDDLSSMLRRAATMWRIQEACKDGELPFKAEEIPNSTGSSHLLRIISGPFEAHVVRTDSSGAFPKDAPIRQDRRLTNEPSLFDPKVVAFEELLGSVKKSYAWLMFNATALGVLTHVCWGMPDRAENKYLAHFDILRRAMSLGTPIDPTTPPKPDPTEKIKFKEHIEQKLEDRKKGDGKKA